MTGYDRELQTDVRTDRLTSAVFVVEKGKPYNYTAIGESVVYVIEGMPLLCCYYPFRLFIRRAM